MWDQCYEQDLEKINRCMVSVTMLSIILVMKIERVNYSPCQDSIRSLTLTSVRGATEYHTSHRRLR